MVSRQNMGSVSLRLIFLLLGPLTVIVNGLPTPMRPPDANATALQTVKEQDIVGNKFYYGPKYNGGYPDNVLRQLAQLQRPQLPAIRRPKPISTESAASSGIGPHTPFDKPFIGPNIPAIGNPDTFLGQDSKAEQKSKPEQKARREQNEEPEQIQEFTVHGENEPDGIPSVPRLTVGFGSYSSTGNKKAPIPLAARAEKRDKGQRKENSESRPFTLRDKDDTPVQPPKPQPSGFMKHTLGLILPKFLFDPITINASGEPTPLPSNIHPIYDTPERPQIIRPSEYRGPLTIPGIPFVYDTPEDSGESSSLSKSSISSTEYTTNTGEEPIPSPSNIHPVYDTPERPQIIRPSDYQEPLAIPRPKLPIAYGTPKDSGESISLNRPAIFSNENNHTSEDDRELSKRETSPDDTYLTEWSTIITLVNATPYRWRKGYSHSYQLEMWDKRFPEYIEPGQSHRIFSSLGQGNILTDSAGEVAYHLEGTSKPMSFLIQRRKGKKHHMFIRFLENLETKANDKGAHFDLGWHMFPGGSTFILAGKEGDFVSTDPPKGWMQALLPEIGHVPLREIVMPRAHHAGMSKGNVRIGVGQAANTLCQTKTVSHQIEQLGVRVLDVRPILFEKVYRAAHGTMILGGWNGMLGETVQEIAEAVHAFHKSYPGELIILDLSTPDTGHLDGGLKEMTDSDIQGLYDILVKWTNPLVLPDNEDITQWPLKRFIGNKKSGTIIRISQAWADRKGFPGGKHGFVADKNFPMNHRWSDKNQGDAMFNDQIDYIRRNKPRRNSRLFHADWLLTQSVGQAIFPIKSINEMALETYGGLYHNLWNATTDETYPNWIATDNIHSSELTSFVVALNHCFVARRCGDLGGKVKKLRG
ncbi:hypothetical protein G7Z17_g12628 [Cylindrodendrum hubeiense]|uniref:Uncharacterized protein n=1 Tax=Cylindrodendrum hubeiense TaxID=595255 RepID=A0A9P5L2X8_9HYPO|nr:hypothetical protein G7Z17_g12628 [Cylindrodendrum hubeiense]